MFSNNENEKEIHKLQIKYKDLKLDPYLELGYTQTEILRLKEAFDLFDINEKGILDIDDLQKNLNDLGIMSKNKDLNILSAEGKKEVDFNLFVELFGAKPVCRNEEEMSKFDAKFATEKLYSAFLGDYDLNRKLGVEDIRKVAEELGLDLAENEIEEMIKSVNPEEPDCISFEEFFRVMSKMEI